MKGDVFYSGGLPTELCMWGGHEASRNVSDLWWANLFL